VRSNLARVHWPSDDLHAIAVQADPNGLAYDRNDDTLYIADGGGAVLAIEQGHRRRVATIDAAGCTADQLGGIAVAPDGTLYVARLGHGHAGAIFQIAGGTVTELPGLSPRAWRLGVAYDAVEHALYATQYHKTETGPCDGSIVRIDLSSGEVDTVVDGLCKPVGVAKLGSTLLITDARRGSVICAELAGPRSGRSTELVIGLDRTDSIAARGLDAVVLTTYRPDTGVGTVRELWLDGTLATIASGRWEPRGIASDGDRAFVSIRRGNRILVCPI
jgi:DNA-binding beta-propeller fold protein YncE